MRTARLELAGSLLVLLATTGCSPGPSDPGGGDAGRRVMVSWRLPSAPDVPWFSVAGWPPPDATPVPGSGEAYYVDRGTVLHLIIRPLLNTSAYGISLRDSTTPTGTTGTFRPCGDATFRPHRVLACDLVIDRDLTIQEWVAGREYRADLDAYLTSTFTYPGATSACQVTLGRANGAVYISGSPGYVDMQGMWVNGQSLVFEFLGPEPGCRRSGEIWQGFASWSPASFLSETSIVATPLEEMYEGFVSTRTLDPITMNADGTLTSTYRIAYARTGAGGTRTAVGQVESIITMFPVQAFDSAAVFAP